MNVRVEGVCFGGALSHENNCWNSVVKDEPPPTDEGLVFVERLRGGTHLGPCHHDYTTEKSVLILKQQRVELCSTNRQTGRQTDSGSDDDSHGRTHRLFLKQVGQAKRSKHAVSISVDEGVVKRYNPNIAQKRFLLSSDPPLTPKCTAYSKQAPPHGCLVLFCNNPRNHGTAWQMMPRAERLTRRRCGSLHVGYPEPLMQ